MITVDKIYPPHYTVCGQKVRLTFENDSSRGGGLFSDSEKEGNHGEDADINSRAGEGVKDSSNEASKDQDGSLPVVELGDFLEGWALLLGIQDSQSGGKRGPNGDEEHLLLHSIEERIDEVDTNNESRNTAKGSQNDSSVFEFDLHEEDTSQGGGHS